MKRLFLSLVVISLLAAGPLATTPQDKAGVERERIQTTQVDPRLQAAFVQQEIILAYLDQEDYDLVLEEYGKLLDLGLSGEHEALLARGTWAVVNLLKDKGAFEVAHQIIDDTLSRTTQRANRYSLLILKGKIYKTQGLIEEAVTTWQLAKKLEE